jgi:hypothetical protein
MKEYRVFVLTFEGNVIQTIALFCASEDAAKLRAQQLVESHPVELWEEPRRLARFEPKH